jgi:hypothetical protein
MIFFIILACVMEESKDSPPKKSLQSLQELPKIDQAKSGRLSAEKAIKNGDLLILEFGEEMPPDSLDLETGLPIGSMGCESDDDEQVYVSAYNNVMKEWIKKTPYSQKI